MALQHIILAWKGKEYHVDLSGGICLAIALDPATAQPNAFHAPVFEATPVRDGDWIGDTREGSPVNFYNVRLNPHGNGTHTECVGHIATERYSIHEALGNEFCIAQLVSVFPTLQEDGDRVVDHLDWEDGVEALIIRTEPNHPDKQKRQYGGTNPPYLDANLVMRMVQHGIRHLLIDLPSVDREEDQGRLVAHKAFWQFPESIRTKATITELIYADPMVKDGLYLLNIQIPAMALDAAPSRPWIYPLS